jgi:hypothetical protein
MMKPINEQELKQLCDEAVRQAPFIKQNHDPIQGYKVAVWSTLFMLLHHAMYDDAGFVSRGNQTTPEEIENLYIDNIKKMLDASEMPRSTRMMILQDFSRRAGLE